MAVLGVDLTDLPLSMRKSIDALCRDEKAAALVAAKARQARIAKWHRDHPPRAINGLGGQTFAFDPVFWSLLRNGAKAAPGEDAEIQEWFGRKHPEACRVRHLPTKTQVGHWSTPERRQGIMGIERGAVRFSKQYA